MIKFNRHDDVCVSVWFSGHKRSGGQININKSSGVWYWDCECVYVPLDYETIIEIADEVKRLNGVSDESRG
ncbi:MAG: hypothetical protein JKY86_15485 [Gammaproteobacteria bacterium]|nr:hypothetical protein [Gammaproteobacteria bacterium]